MFGIWAFYSKEIYIYCILCIIKSVVVGFFLTINFFFVVAIVIANHLAIKSKKEMMVLSLCFSVAYSVQSQNTYEMLSKSCLKEIITQAFNLNLLGISSTAPLVLSVLTSEANSTVTSKHPDKY